MLWCFDLFSALLVDLAEKKNHACLLSFCSFYIQWPEKVFWTTLDLVGHLENCQRIAAEKTRLLQQPCVQNVKALVCHAGTCFSIILWELQPFAAVYCKKKLHFQFMHYLAEAEMVNAVCSVATKSVCIALSCVHWYFSAYIPQKGVEFILLEILYITKITFVEAKLKYKVDPMEPIQTITSIS